MTTETMTLTSPVDDARRSQVAKGTAHASSLAGTIWFVGWLFTIGFAQLAWWQAFLAIVLWPYFLGGAFR